MIFMDLTSAQAAYYGVTGNRAMSAALEVGLVAVSAAALWLLTRKKKRPPFVSVPDPWTVKAERDPSEASAPDEESDTRTDAPPVADHWDTDWLRGRDDEIGLKTSARITYRDGAGRVTKREINVSYFYPEGDAAVLAFCRLRQGNRTFLLSGMREYVDLETGEVVGDVASHLHALHDASPGRIAELALDEHMDELSVLMFVARASGRLTQTRRALTARYLYEAEPHTDEGAISAILPGYQVAQPEFRASLKRLSRAPAPLRASLLQTVEQMRGKSTDNEFVDAAIAASEKALS